jgi:hypothetical protein
LATCQYCQYKYKSKTEYRKLDFTCNEKVRTGSSTRCIFHDKNYVKDHYEEFEHEATKRFEEKIRESISENKPLECIGYYLPAIEFAKYFPTTTLTEKSFSQPVYFVKTTFYGANFYRATFPDEANFSYATFSNEANFFGAIFSNEATFYRAIFSNEAHFNRAKFSNKAHFNQATFSNKADFRATFSNEANFTAATFSNEANFTAVLFSNNAYFRYPTFSNKAHFNRAKFSQLADFYIAKFSNKAYFNEAEFSKEATFYRATFSELANFTWAIFSELANFNQATFSNKAYFFQTRFTRLADFSAATFSNIAEFGGATFSNEANFNQAIFSNEATFNVATFSNEANFREAEFSNKADFTEATFSNEASFSGATFSNDKPGTFFNYIIFEKPSKVIFNGDLSNISFAGSDITRIRFGDKIRWRKDGYTIIEEEWLKEQTKRKQNKDMEEIERPSLELVSSVYRNLRENYEFRLRYDDAGKFFIKEMELKRKYREALTISPIKRKLWLRLKLKLKGNNSPIPNIENVLIQNGRLRRNFSLNGLYYHFSRYGESIWRPTVIGAITVGLSTLLWLTQSDPTLQLSFLQNNPSSSNIANFTGTANFTNPSHWVKSFERSIADFIPLLPMSSEIKVGIIDYIIKIVGGALTFGLLIIALRRKFERKYTR